MSQGTRFYISQDRLDVWSGEEKLVFDGDSVTLNDTGQIFMVVPAVYFTGVSGGDNDNHDLLGTVHTEAEIAEMGAEHYLTSVIYGDIAYEVQQGFLGEARAAE